MYTISAIFPDGIRAVCDCHDERLVRSIVADMEEGTVYTVHYNGFLVSI
jgi:hypothetical protein